MAEIARLSGCSDWIDLVFMERQRTPPQLMKLGIRLHLAGLSLSNTVRELEKFGVQRSRKAVHDWIQKADLQPADDASPNHVALDETVIRVNDEQYRLYAVVDLDTNRYLHIRLFPTYKTALTGIFLRELREKHDVSDAVFLVDGARHLQTALRRSGLRFRCERHGNRNSVERVFREVKRRTSSFSNTFSHVDPATAETWLQSFAVWHNSLNYHINKIY
jgi:putative transposase